MQPGLTPQLVQGPRWGEIGRLAISGVAYAQPLYTENVPGPNGRARDLVFVATGSNEVSAFDAGTLGKAWSINLGPNDKTAIHKICDGLSLPGGIGTEATPVIDRSHDAMYVSYRVNPAGGLETAQQRLRAIDIRDGRTIADRQVLPPQAPPDWTQWHRSRAGLLLLDGVVYVAFGSRCEDPGTPGFHGWVLGYDAKTLQELASFSPTLNMPGGQPVDGGGIWQGASGLAADEQGNIYTATGNRRAGVDGRGPEVPSLADSFIKLTPVVHRDGSGAIVGPVELRLTDWFTPYRQVWLDDQDLDLAASGPVRIPNTNFLIGGGKSGILYTLDRGNMGRFDQAHAWNLAKLNSLPLDMVQAEAPEDGAADKVAQKFQAAFNQYVPTGSPSLPHAGAPVAAAPQGGDQLDLFAIGRDGAAYVYWETGDGAWTDGTSGRRGPAAITPPGLAPPNARVVAAPQGASQLDAFVVGRDGGVHVAWVSGKGSWTAAPGPITPAGLAPPGAPLAAAAQGANQLDVFTVGNDGGVHVAWVVGGGAWTAATNPITPAHLAPPGAAVAVAPQGENQLDAFVVGQDGGVHVAWVVGGGAWTSAPGPIPPAPLAPPGAWLAAAHQGTEQLDAFVVGSDGAVHVAWVNGGGAWNAFVPITPPGLAPPGACVTAARQNGNQLDVFTVGKDGAAYVSWVIGGGAWAGPAPITPPHLAPPGSCVAAAHQNASQLDAFVTGVNGAIFLTFERNDGRWTDGRGIPQAPISLNQAVWMKGCWWCWPHIHGPPVFAAFPGGPSMIYLWPEKDHLKAYRWLGNRIDPSHPQIGTDKAGHAVLAPPGPPMGMPGGMLSVAVDPAGSGVLFGSIARTDDQMLGMLRAFDPLSLREIWNNAGTDYHFAKYVAPTIAGGKVFLPTASNAIIVYGAR